MLHSELLLPLKDLPLDGRTFTITEQDIYPVDEPVAGLSISIAKPITATVTVIPTEEGCLVRGQLSGLLLLPCTRCAEPFHFTLQSRFEDFEPLAPKSQAEDAQHELDESRIITDGEQNVLDLASLLREEFLLAIPSSPVCKEDCLGLCSGCGANLNTEACTCSKDEGDPRLAIFRTLSLKR